MTDPHIAESHGHEVISLSLNKIIRKHKMKGKWHRNRVRVMSSFIKSSIGMNFFWKYDNPIKKKQKPGALLLSDYMFCTHSSSQLICPVTKLLILWTLFCILEHQIEWEIFWTYNSWYCIPKVYLGDMTPYNGETWPSMSEFRDLKFSSDYWLSMIGLSTFLYLPQPQNSLL